MTNRYVYGVVRADDAPEFETAAVGGAELVYSVTQRRLAAVVSDVETTDPERTDEDAKRHDEVLRQVMEREDDGGEGGRTVVPMQFGMVFESDRALKNVLRGARPAFRRALRDVDGRVELGLKLVSEADADVDREAIEAAVEEELEPRSVDSVSNGLFSDRLVLNRSYLVDRDDREAFDAAVGRFEDDHEDLLVKYTGPFAPYSFVDVHVGAR